MQQPIFGMRHVVADVQIHALLTQPLLRQGAGPRCVLREEAAARHQAHGELRVVAALGELLLEPRVHGHRQLEAPGPTAHNEEPPLALPCRHPFKQVIPPSPEVADGLHGRHTSLRGVVLHLRCRADVDREHVVADGRPVAVQQHALVLQIQPNGGSLNQAHAREAGEHVEVEVALAPCVRAGDMPGQHPAVRGLHVPRDQGDANPGHGLHGQHAQHIRVRVPTPDQDKVFDDWRVLPLLLQLQDLPRVLEQMRTSVQSLLADGLVLTSEHEPGQVLHVVQPRGLAPAVLAEERTPGVVDLVEALEAQNRPQLRDPLHSLLPRQCRRAVLRAWLEHAPQTVPRQGPGDLELGVPGGPSLPAEAPQPDADQHAARAADQSAALQPPWPVGPWPSQRESRGH
mmetsp:Transcript_88285/g.249276  ORF Transcript_88285/g.249276 Transcript_88285/m.249276 type:complete len:400 (-) Transcript_88285:30-1229(-)